MNRAMIGRSEESSSPRDGGICRATAEWRAADIQLIAGSATRGEMATCLVTVVPAREDLDARQFLWTLQQQRRPPKQGCWLVWECLAMDGAIYQTL
jgi:hypothetical protein